MSRVPFDCKQTDTLISYLVKQVYLEHSVVERKEELIEHSVEFVFVVDSNIPNPCFFRKKTLFKTRRMSTKCKNNGKVKADYMVIDSANGVYKVQINGKTQKFPMPNFQQNYLNVKAGYNGSDYSRDSNRGDYSRDSNRGNYFRSGQAGPITGRPVRNPPGTTPPFNPPSGNQAQTQGIICYGQKPAGSFSCDCAGQWGPGGLYVCVIMDRRMQMGTGSSRQMEIFGTVRTLTITKSLARKQRVFLLIEKKNC
jgi:hypothetical protein